MTTIEEIAPSTNSYAFTNCLVDDEWGAKQYESIRSLAERRGSLFLPVMLTCEVDEQVRRILLQPPSDDVLHVDTTTAEPAASAAVIYDALVERGLTPRRPSA